MCVCLFLLLLLWLALLLSRLSLIRTSMHTCKGGREGGREGREGVHICCVSHILTSSLAPSLPPSLLPYRAVVTATSNLRAANYKIPGRYRRREGGREGG